ncbi:MAG TPA: hypothetical protein PKI11_14905 [Candidatus Hydrogenedentes bacterium]|nr:hypothetical protein [Candidatus Hydrogenedentota bacterium]
MRTRRHSRLMTRAFLISFLLHLSAITVFRVVIFFPRQDIEYVEFQIVQAAPAVPAPGDGPDGADFSPSSWDMAALGGSLQLGGERLLMGEGPPPVALPTLEFAELNRLRVRRDALLDPERRDAIFRDEPRDTWRRFGDELGRLRETLTGLTLSSEQGDEDTPRAAGGAPAVHRPAEGFEAHLEWESEPANRELLFAPPMQALWDLAPGQLTAPLSLVIEVNPIGRVINVWSPPLGDSAILDSVQATVLKYRFEPLDDPAAGNQMGTLHVARARGGL